MSEPADEGQRGSSRSATSCCSRSTTSRPSGRRATIDDESYAELHDDYTARAAATLRALRDGVDARPARPPVPASRRVLVIGGLVVFAVVAAVALAFALGARLPGETSSGNSTVTVDARRDRLEATVRDNPDDVEARLALARFLERQGATLDSLKAYDAAVRIAPENGDALANAGRLRYIVAGQLPSAEARRAVRRDGPVPARPGGHRRRPTSPTRTTSGA